jgi:hypothetical protein
MIRMPWWKELGYYPTAQWQKHGVLDEGTMNERAYSYCA